MSLSPSAESLSMTETDDLAAAAIVSHPGCPAESVVRIWHDGVHAGAYPTCQEQPCNAVRRVCD